MLLCHNVRYNTKVKDQDRSGEGWAIKDCIEYNGFKISEVAILFFQNLLSYQSKNYVFWPFPQIEKRPFTEKVHSGHVWDGCMSLHFQDLDETVKANHFPGIQELGNKKKLFKVSFAFEDPGLHVASFSLQNFSYMRKKHGPGGWKFMEDTFMLPSEVELLKAEMAKNPKKFWIAKPPDSACGRGIQIISDIRDLPNTNTPLCVQRYIMDPLLINGLKFRVAKCQSLQLPLLSNF